MREKIIEHLEKAGRPLSSEQILREALNILSPNSIVADRVLKGIAGRDPRLCRRGGLWRLTGREASPRTPSTAALHLEWNAGHPGRFRGSVYVAADGSSSEFLRTETAPGAVASLRDTRLAAENHLLLIWSRKELQMWNRLLRSLGVRQWHGDALAVNRLAARTLPGPPRRRQLQDLAQLLELPVPDAEDMSAMARLLSEAFHCLLERVPPGRRATRSDLESWIAEGELKVDFGRFAFGRDQLARLPEAPGVYLMRDRAGKVIYVGQSANLRRRLRSYFTPRAIQDPKVSRIHRRLHTLEHVTCPTEVDALLLEMRMIRDFRPPINLQSEIHERPARYGRDLNLLLLVPAGDRAEVYLLREGVFAGRHWARMGRTPPKKLGAKIRALYFGARRGRSRTVAEAWETEIVARWISARRKRLNMIDIDEAGSFESVQRRLEFYLKDPGRLAAKVYYL